MEPSKMSQEQLDSELARLRKLKDDTREQLVALVREYDKRARLKRVEEQFPGLVQQVSGVGGVESDEAVGRM
jgi:CBS-domain-containing membrane protein